MKKTIMFATLLAGLLLATCAFAADSQDRTSWPTHLRFLTGPAGGQWFFMGEPIAEILSNEVLPSTSRIGGGVNNIDTINNKLGDLGFTLTCFMGASQSGEDEYKNINTDNVVIMANIYPQVLYFLIRKDFADANGIKTVEELLQKQMPLRFASLKPGTASEFILQVLLKDGYNTSFDKLRAQGWQINFNNYAETADNFVGGDIDCFAYTAGTEVPLILTMESHTEVIILPIKQEVLDKLAEKFGTGTYVIKPGVYKSISQPVHTLGDYTTIAIRKDFPDDLVYEICKSLWNNKNHIASVIKDYGQLSPATAIAQKLEMHPGALKFWQEQLSQ